MASNGGFRCACFFTHNYYSRLLNGHFRYIDKDSFLREYGQRLALVPVGHDCDGDDGVFAAAADGKVGVGDVIAELEEELERRRLLGAEISRRKAEILRGFAPKHPHLYDLSEEFLAPELLRLVQKCREGTGMTSMMNPGNGEHPTLKREGSACAPVFSFPVFTPEFCSLLMEELKYFEDSPLPKGRPNTMNRRGILLDELLGFERGFVDVLREEYVQPLVDRLMPGERLLSFRLSLSFFLSPFLPPFFFPPFFLPPVFLAFFFLSSFLLSSFLISSFLLTFFLSATEYFPSRTIIQP